MAFYNETNIFYIAALHTLCISEYSYEINPMIHNQNYSAFLHVLGFFLLLFVSVGVA